MQEEQMKAQEKRAQSGDKKAKVVAERNYECLYIIAGDVSEEKRGELVTKFSKMAGAGTKVDKWGMRKFATPINYKKEGFYVLMNFSASPDLVGKMSALMNITEGIVRYMFIVKNDAQIEADAVRKAQRAENRAKYAAVKAEAAAAAAKAE